jgi:hypothetical protein
MPKLKRANLATTKRYLKITDDELQAFADREINPNRVKSTGVEG